MSSWKNRKEEKRAAQEAAMERDARVRAGEQERKAALSMWGRIEEAEASADVKEILHLLAEKVGLE